MIHRISIFSNPRIFIPFLINIVLIACGITVAALLNVTIGVIILIISGLLLNGLFKLVIPILKSSIEVEKDSISYNTGYGKSDVFAFADITEAGIVINPAKKRYLYVYCDESGKYLSIPDEFSGFDKIIDHVKAEFTLSEHVYEGKGPVSEYMDNLFSQRNVSE